MLLLHVVSSFHVVSVVLFSHRGRSHVSEQHYNYLLRLILVAVTAEEDYRVRPAGRLLLVDRMTAEKHLAAR